MSKGLFKGGQRIELPPKESALLELLVSLDGGTATHRMIEDAVWPRQQVSYASLTRCVYSLRKLLGDENAGLIKTVPRRGYRLDTGTEYAAEGVSSRPRQHSTDRAHNHYVAGLQEAHSPIAQAMSNALDEFQAALEQDAGYVPAYCGMAEVRMYQALRSQISPRDAFTQGMDACASALELQPDSARARAVMAWFIGVIEADTGRAMALLAEAERSDPTQARTFSYRSWVCRVAGDTNAMLHNAEKAQSIQSRDLLTRHLYTWSLFLSGRAAEALEAERGHMRHFPLDEIACGYAGIYAAYLGLHDEAQAAYERAFLLDVGDPCLHAAHAYVLALRGRSGEARGALELANDGGKQMHCPGLLAPAQLALGDETATLRTLQAARDARCPWFRIARLDPRLGPLANAGKLDYLYSR